MKLKLIFLFTVLVFTLTYCMSDEKNDDTIENKKVHFTRTDKFGKYMFNTFKNNDYNKFSSYIMDVNDFDYFILSVKANETEKKEFLTKKNEYLKKLHYKCKNAFTKIYKKGIEAGINWKETKFEGIDCLNENNKGFKEIDIYIIFSYKRINYKINLDDCRLLEKGWVIGDDPRWKG